MFSHFHWLSKSDVMRMLFDWLRCSLSACMQGGAFYGRKNGCCPTSQWSGWVSIVQKIRIGNFWFCKFLWVQILANIRPLKNSYHFDTFHQNYWEINCLELFQNWVESPYLTILFSDQFQKKNLNFHTWK